MKREIKEKIVFGQYPYYMIEAEYIIEVDEIDGVAISCSHYIKI